MENDEWGQSAQAKTVIQFKIKELKETVIYAEKKGMLLPVIGYCLIFVIEFQLFFALPK